ncbi:site-specific DNA-methyltransferase [Candidatus Woesearchaeota archaeon]|nr:site-specific DNA-methyltransferase [Candidatus Woesearchaeota archaeon]
MRNFPAGKVNLIVTDPPYNASNGGINLPNNKTGGAYYKVNEDWDKLGNYSSYLDFTRKWSKETDRLLVPTGSIMVCGSLHNIGEVIIALKELNYKFINLITWKKTNPMPSITKRTLTHSTEFIVWFAKGSGWTFNYKNMKKYAHGKQLKDVWEFPVCQGKERIKGKNRRAAHPTQKPLEIFKRLIEMASNESDVVLDPFIGSGTTAIASELLNRKWVGIDNKKEYIEIANKRIEHLRKNKKLTSLV